MLTLKSHAKTKYLHLNVNFTAHPHEEMSFSSAPQRDADHPPDGGTASLKSLQLLKKISSETTTAPNAPTTGAVGRSHRGSGRIWIRPKCFIYQNRAGVKKKPGARLAFDYFA